MIDMSVPLIKVAHKPSSDPRRQIFSGKFHITLDNYFSSNNTLAYLGELGLGSILTCHQDRLPAGIKKFLHAAKGVLVNHRSRCARYESPIIATKHVPAQAGKVMYSLTHVSFQSMRSCNLSSVNSLDKVDLYIRSAPRRGVDVIKSKSGVSK